MLLTGYEWYVIAAAIAVLSMLLYPFRSRTIQGFESGKMFSPLKQPFFGSLMYVTYHFDRYHSMILDVARDFGDGVNWTAGIVGNPAFVYIGADPVSLEHVLKTAFWKYEKGDWFKQTMEVLLGEGIFNVDGAEWQKQRKVASHMFTARSLREDMSKIFFKNAQTVMSKIANYAKEKKAFDIQDLFFRYTLDSFSEVAFGEGCGCLSDGAPVPFALAFDTIQSCANQRFFQPTFLWKLKRFFRLGSERHIRAHMKVIKAFGEEVIERTRERRSKQSAEENELHPDLLSRFIHYAEEQNQTISNQELLDVVLNFIIAGRDTTACLLSWAIYELTQHPSLQTQIFEEVNGFVSTHIIDEENGGVRAVRELPLLHAFIMEVLRLHPSVPQDSKQCVKDDVWPHTGQFVPAGTMIVYSPFLMGRSKNLWGEDADKFNINRWFDKETGLPVKEPSQFKMPVFNAGPRLCLGKSVAILETTMLLSLAISQFKFAAVDKDVTYAISVTMPIKNGFRVMAEART